MAKLTITSANANLVLFAPPIVVVPVRLEGFASDTMMNIPSAQIVETRMGVDGIKSAGKVNNLKPFSIELQADSPSIKYFNQITAYQQTLDALYFTLTVEIPSIKKKAVFTNCTLNTEKMLPDMQKVLEAITYDFDCEAISMFTLG